MQKDMRDIRNVPQTLPFASTSCKIEVRLTSSLQALNFWNICAAVSWCGSLTTNPASLETMVTPSAGASCMVTGWITSR